MENEGGKEAGCALSIMVVALIIIGVVSYFVILIMCGA